MRATQEQRNYYCKRHAAGCVISEYIGGGPFDEAIAELDALERLAWQERRAALGRPH